MSVRRIAFEALLRLCSADVVSVAYRGSLGREVEPDERAKYLGRILTSSDLVWVINELCKSEEHWHNQLQARCPSLVRILYRGLLGREPEPDALKGYTERLSKTHDLAQLISEISHSDEHWWRTFDARSPELVRYLYRGLLEREPEPKALKSYAEKLAETHDLALLLADIAHSDEHWKKALIARAPTLVRAIFTGLLNKEPSPEEVQEYSAQLTETFDIAALLATLSRSDELWEELFALRAPELVKTIYRNLLQRDVDPLGLLSYASVIAEPQGVGKVLSNIVGSADFIRSHQRDAVVFLHIQKTAGTSLQGMLRDRFGKDVYGEHADSLAKHTPKKLSAFSVFSGHFNHDSLGVIPRRRLAIFTFVREPKERLVSLYYFWRAHEPFAPGWGGGQKLANDFLIEDFFSRSGVKQSPEVWNHMTWVIMGHQQWEHWRLALANADSDDSTEFIASTVRPAIRQRIREFAFVGLHADFSRSVDLLCDILNWPRFRTIRTDHSLERLAQKHPHFKQSIDRQPVTELLSKLLDECVQLDNVVYEESVLLYAERLTQLRQCPALGARKVYDSEVSSFSELDVKEFKLVFVRLQRTGATTLHNVLRPHFEERKIWPEPYNALRHHPAGELARYRYFFGEFDLPSVRLIPGPKRIITIFREPVARLVSLYRFLRAHRGEVIERHGFELARLARESSIIEFFGDNEVRSHCSVNNAMTRALTQACSGEKGSSYAADDPCQVSQCLDVALAIGELDSLDAFGIFERFDESVRLVLSAAEVKESPLTLEGSPDPERAYGDEHEKAMEPLTDELKELLRDLVAADARVYQHAVGVFEKRLLALHRPTSRARRARRPLPTRTKTQ